MKLMNQTYDANTILTLNNYILNNETIPDYSRKLYIENKQIDACKYKAFIRKFADSETIELLYICKQL